MIDSIFDILNLGSALGLILILTSLGILLTIIKRYQVVPSDKIIVVFGMIGGDDKSSAKCKHGGVVFVWPLIQSYQ